MVSFSFTAGLLLRGRMRSFLARTQYEGHEIEWREFKGLIDSVFVVRSKDEALLKVLAEHLLQYAGPR